MRIMTNPNRGRGNNNGTSHANDSVDVDGAVFGISGMQIIDPKAQSTEGRHQQHPQRGRASFRGVIQGGGRGLPHTFVQTQAPQHTFGPPRGHFHRGRGHFDHHGRGGPRGAPRGRGRGFPPAGPALEAQNARPA